MHTPTPDQQQWDQDGALALEAAGSAKELERLAAASDGRLVGARRDYVIWLYPRRRRPRRPHRLEAFPRVRAVVNHLTVGPGPGFWRDDKGRPRAEVPMPPVRAAPAAPRRAAARPRRTRAVPPDGEFRVPAPALSRLPRPRRLAEALTLGAPVAPTARTPGTERLR